MRHLVLSTFFIFLISFASAQSSAAPLIGKWISSKMQIVAANNANKATESHNIAGERIYNFTSATSCVMSGAAIGQPTTYTYTLKNDFLILKIDLKEHASLNADEKEALGEPEQAYYIKVNVAKKQLIFSEIPFNSKDEDFNFMVFKKS